MGEIAVNLMEKMGRDRRKKRHKRKTKK